MIWNYYRYIIGHVVLDRRHVGNTSPEMENTGLHALCKKLAKANVPVHELATDEHSRVLADFSKVFYYKCFEYAI